MSQTPAAYPEVATREEWLTARRRLLAQEREVTHLRDEVNAERRRMPMVKVDKDCVFEGRPQLYVHHFMGIDATDRGCPSCTAAADLSFTEKDRSLLEARGLTFACVSRAPYASIARYRDEHDWSFPCATAPSATTIRRRSTRRGPRSNTTTSRSTNCMPPVWPPAQRSRRLKVWRPPRCDGMLTSSRVWPSG